MIPIPAFHGWNMAARYSTRKVGSPEVYEDEERTNRDALGYLLL
jgi:hypothetical protein